MSYKLITIAVFQNYIDAHMTAELLKSGGIHAFIRDEYISTMNWAYSNATGGVKVQVRESDVQSAKELLNDVDKADKQDYEYLRCPQCGSADIADNHNILVSLFFVLIATAIPPMLRGRYKCRSCNHKWKEPKSKNV